MIIDHRTCINYNRELGLLIIENLTQELYNADETLPQSITLEKGVYTNIQVTCKADAPTTFTVDYSYDNSNWFNIYTSATPETDYLSFFQNAAPYIRLSSAAAGIATNVESLVIAAVP